MYICNVDIQTFFIRYDSVFEFESDKKCENTYVSNPFSHLDSWYTSCSSVFRWKRTSCRGFHAGQTTLGSFVTGRTASIPCLPCSCGGVVGACRARWTEYVPTWLHPRVCVCVVVVRGARGVHVQRRTPPPRRVLKIFEFRYCSTFRLFVLNIIQS